MFVDFFIRRPVFATVCALLIVLAGAVVIPGLPISLYPFSGARHRLLSQRPILVRMPLP